MIILYILIFIFGLCVGSFLNVVINRLELEESIVIGRSHCPKCKIELKWFDLIPLLSFVFLRGKCRYCNKKISWQYPLVELITGLLFLLFFNSIYHLIVICFLIIIFVYDLKHYIIPDQVIYPAIAISFVYAIVNYNNLLYLFLCLSGAVFFLLIVLVSKGKWMGLGDVKLAVFMGFVLGWFNILLALFLSFVFGSIVGIILILFKKKKIKSEIPFGPFLCLATVIVMLYGNQILDWYLRILF
ncbi:prepilin peptidase [Patescibacteria group bacterium]